MAGDREIEAILNPESRADVLCAVKKQKNS